MDAALELTTPIGGVPAEHVREVWPRVEPILKRVVKPQTGFDLHHVLTELQLRRWQLWVIGNFDAIVITSIVVRPLHKVLWIEFIAGRDMETWLDDWITTQEAYAKATGCKAVEFAGRAGWSKIRERHRDYKPIRTTYRKELT